jgi:hypothetical protein
LQRHEVFPFSLSEGGTPPGVLCAVPLERAGYVS